MRHSIALLFSLLCACNSVRNDSCVTASTAIVGAGTAPSNCKGTCVDVPIPDAGGASLPFCKIPCTGTCDDGKTCASLADLGVFDSDASFCVYPCAKVDPDAGDAAPAADAAACPKDYTCSTQYGVCF